MLEIDELKKARESDVVDLNRIKNVVLDIDKRTMLRGSGMNGKTDDYDCEMKDTTNGYNHREPHATSRSSRSRTPTGHRQSFGR